MEHAASRTAERVRGRDVLAIQDTTELVFGGRRARKQGFGPVGKGGAIGGLLLHPVVAVEVETGAVLGLAGAEVWNRTAKVKHRRSRATAEKESRRWLAGAESAGRVLQEAARITVVADRESDVYEAFARRPANVHMITRAAQDRLIEDGTRIFTHVDGLAERDRIRVTIPAAPGRAEREALLALRFAPITLRAPLHGSKKLPQTLPLSIVDLREVEAAPGVKPVHWRLLTTHTVDTLADARMVVDFYRQRWTIERYFRTLKTGAFDLEDADIGDPEVMSRFVAAVAVAAVTVMQLVQARDGLTDQRLEDAFDPEDAPLIEALSCELEGKTARQKNPHTKGSLAFATWVIARLGGWTGYYGKPGSLVVRRGLHDFQRIRMGAKLRFRDV